MTEQSDTAEIRAALRTLGLSQLDVVVIDLCDAVDAARAERDHWEQAALAELGRKQVWLKALEGFKARAEAAEDRIAELERTIEGNWRQIGKQGREILNLHAREEEDLIRVEAAEARIADALAYIDNPDHRDSLGRMTWYEEEIMDVRRALTGGTP